ncbi:P-loop containing nucleoside triphosphate hydrolase protein, partial [Lactarius indigo]
PTGSGKTLTFWIPLLFNGDGVSIVITPLNVLGEKNVDELSLVSIPAVNLTTSSASDKTFKEIESLKFRVIITSPERILTDRRFPRSMEAHCISQWSGDFRPEYAEVGRLRWLLPGHVIFYATSATMPHHVLDHVKSILQMRPDRTREIQLSNDCPNIHLLTLEMSNPAHTYHDILRVLRFDGNPPPPPFMVFCNDRKETERLCQFACSQAPSGLVGKLLWFHSAMSTTFRTETIRKLHSHEIWGIFCTDAAGMGLDLHDVELVVQWKHTQSLCMLWQRLGRAARDPSKEATGIYIVEPQYMDHCRVQAEQRVASQAERSRLQEVPDTENVASSPRRQVRVEGGHKGCPRTRKKPHHQPNQSGSMVPHATGNLIIQEQRHQDYEAAAMDAYINTRSRGICRRRIPNEFFGNWPGM